MFSSYRCRNILSHIIGLSYIASACFLAKKTDFTSILETDKGRLKKSHCYKCFPSHDRSSTHSNEFVCFVLNKSLYSRLWITKLRLPSNGGTDRG